MTTRRIPAPVLRSKLRLDLAVEVAEVLRARIYDGTYAPGSSLLQEQIAADLQVSRTPLREALAVLEHDGLVTTGPGRGVRVVLGDRKKLLAGYAMREVVDGLAARLASARATRADQLRFDRVIARQRAALDPWSHTDFTAGNVAFHALIVELADNTFVTAQTPLLHVTSQVYTSGSDEDWNGDVPLLSRPRAAGALDEHLGIAEAVLVGDGELAEQRARAHIKETIDRLSAYPPLPQNVRNHHS